MLVINVPLTIAQRSPHLKIAVKQQGSNEILVDTDPLPDSLVYTAVPELFSVPTNHKSD